MLYIGAYIAQYSTQARHCTACRAGMDALVQRVVEQNVIAAAQQMEEQLDGELHRLETLGRRTIWTGYENAGSSSSNSRQCEGSNGSPAVTASIRTSQQRRSSSQP